jgi:Mrp family chromosome partitioning ATPase
VSTQILPRRPLNTKPATAFDPYRRAVRHHPLLVSIVALIAVAVAVAWTTQRAHHYEATAQILVSPQTADAATSGLPILSASVDPTRTLQTAATMMTSPQSAAMAIKQLNTGQSVAEVRAQVTVEPEGDADIVGVTASTSSRQAALKLANVYANAALLSRRDTLRRQVADKLAAVQAREKALGDPNSPAASTLAGQASTLRSILQGPDPNFSLLQAAVPTAPSGKSTTYKLAIGVLSALALAVAVALVVERFDRRVRDEDELTALAPLAVLARVPSHRHHRGQPIVPAGATEALHALQIQLEARAGDTHTVVITSPSQGDGKTTIALALAHTLAAADQQIVLLDLDLRKADLGQRQRVRSDLLTMLDDDSIEQALVPVDGVPNLRVLSAPAAGVPETIIQDYSRRLPEIVERVRPYGRFIVIDTPPIGHVADALLLAARADDVLLVARPGHTDRRDLAAAQQSLQQLRIAPTGLIVVGATRRVRRYHDFAGGDPHVAPDPSSAHPAGAAAGPDH